MKTILVAALLLATATRAQAGATYLGIDNQPVSNAPDSQLLVGSTETLKVQQQGTVTVTPGTGTFKAEVTTGSITAFQGGSWSITTTQPTGPMTVTPGTGTWNTSGSTNIVAGAGGVPISTVATAGGTTSLSVLNQGAPNLSGKSLVYAADNNMAVGTLSLTGLIKSVDLQALVGSCTFNINGGASIVISKNTSESFDLAYTLSNAAVNLTSKGAGATCKARVVGAN